ncbi:uncharacterized protein LOC135207412 [Macrobrachium nipponense]|uniref:uncharacterized protein LOC135207412 n=1 Tax=Macrobrachium nipponense TaxID=159736 RepID=UPI0030C8935C
MPLVGDKFEEAAALFLARSDWEEEIFDLKRDELWCLAEYLNLGLPTDIRKGQLLCEVLKAIKSSKGNAKEAVTSGDPDFVNNGSDEELGDSGSQEVSKLRLSILSQEFKLKEMEYKTLQLRAEEREKERKFELRMREFNNNNNSDNNHNNNHNRFELMSALKLMPVFDEEDVPDFFISFERIARKLSWPKDMWTTMVQCKLKGKAQRVYNTLSEDLSADYDSVKAIILKAYDLVPEAYRQKFRNLKKEPGMTFVEFARRKEQFLDDWLESRETDSFKKLKELILVEEFKRMVARELKIHLDELKLDSLQEIAIASDEYSLAHRQDCVKEVSGKRFPPRGNSWRGNNRNQSGHGTFIGSSVGDRGKSKNENDNKSNGSEARSFVNSSRNGSSSNDSRSSRSDVVCFWCHRRGHFKADCFARRKFFEKNEEPVTLVSAEQPQREESK